MRATGRATAAGLVWCLAALQGSVLLTFMLVPAQLPPRVTLLELLWAAPRRPQFYPLVTLLVAGPVLSVLAWRVRGRHRAALVACWLVFAAVIFTCHMDRVRVMLRVLVMRYL